ncbi:hypothetical protein ACFFGH_08870 [Lysobacter korlensis]|uniref:Uncharacterized protein n=1 Tax=Lysobacter korlensis TaxID=553636 RepID=A0ABV6RLW4_9GAMM
MSLRPPVGRLCRLAVAIAAICSASAQAQQLPHRNNLEKARGGEVRRLFGLDRHAIEVPAGGLVLAPIDEGGRLIDLQARDGALPTVWSSDGTALFAARPPLRLGEQHWLYDSAAVGARWLLLEGAAEPNSAIVHVRDDGGRGAEDSWQVPLRAESSGAERSRPAMRDEVLAVRPGQPLRFVVDGQKAVRAEVWRPQVPRLLPPDATWLRVEADGRVIFDGRLPTPTLRERPYVTSGCAQVLDLAARVELGVPAGTRELRVHGEPGTWLKLLGPLPGTPARLLAPAGGSPTHGGTEPGPGEPVRSAFNRAVLKYPDPAATAFLGRYSYYRDAAVLPAEGRTLQSRAWRVRYPDRERRGDLATNAPDPSANTVGATTFHWLEPGGRWQLDLPREARLGLLRISVANAAADQQPVRLRASQPGSPTQLLRLEPLAVDALRGASSSADALLAVDPDGLPIIDASQAVLPVADLRVPVALENTGATGAWVAVEQRVPALRRLAEASLQASLLPAAVLRNALLDDAPASAESVSAADNVAATRAIEQARALLQARARAFASDACVAAAASPAAGAADRAVLVAAESASDPVLQRCAVLQAVAADPAHEGAWAALDRWATANERADLRTGFLAWALRDPGRRSDATLWQRLEEALLTEGDAEAAALVRNAAGTAHAPAPMPPESAASEQVLPSQSAGAVRLRTERETELVYALADQRAADWVFPQAGEYTLELRSFTPGTGPQWVTLRSGGLTWRTALRPARDDAGSLRDIATGASAGSAVRIRFQAPAPGSVLEIAAEAGAMLARVDAAGRIGTAPAAQGSSRVQPVEVAVAAECRLETVQRPLQILIPAPPAPVTRGTASIMPAETAPVIASPGAAATPETDDATRAALQALWLIEHGEPEAGLAAASRAMHLRDRATSSQASAAMAMLEDRLTWRRVEPESSAGKTRREIADGHSTNPVVARRQVLAAATAEDRFVLRPGQGWVLEGLQPGQRVQLSLEHRSALAAGRVDLGLTNGQRYTLDVGERRTVTDVADAEGELHLRVGDALPGAFVTMVVATAAGEPLDPRRELLYHRPPLQLRLDGPRYLRIVEWNGQTSAIRTEWVPQAGTVTLRPQLLPNAALRVSQMELAPPAAAAEPRTEPAAPVADPSAVTAAIQPPPAPVVAPHAPPLAQAWTWPQRWPGSGGEDGTWGLVASVRERLDADDPDSDRERFTELTWRYRYRLDDWRLWGRLDAVGRRHDEGFGTAGLRHSLQWRPAFGPWGASFDVAAWRQRTPASLGSSAHAVEARLAVEWEQRRDERWRDEWQLGVRWRDLSLRAVPRSLRARLDNDVYSQYRDAHGHQIDLGYTLRWRARYDSEAVLAAQLISNPVDDFGIDQVGIDAAWRWARHGWTTSAGLDVRRFLPDANRARSFQRERLELDVGRLYLGYGHGWRIRASAGYEFGTRQSFGGLSVEWFDHDGRGLNDFAPSELFLRGVTENDLYGRLLPPDETP